MIIIERKIFGNSTIAEYSINQNIICYTLEDCARPIGVKVKGRTCIPEGDYHFAITHSVRFGRALPLIYNREDYSVSDGIVSWTGIRIHAGNTEADTEGCILVGTVKDIDFIGNSRKALDKVFPLMMDLLAEGKTEIKIINNQSTI